MNKNNRTQLDIATKHLDDALTILSDLGQGEQDKFDNLSEGLQESERGQKFQDNADALSEATDALENAKSSIEEAADALNNVE